AIRNMIRESKVHQIDSVIASSADESMVGMDASLLKLYKDGVIEKQVALDFASSPDLMLRKMV
ncbi:MAG: type IV pili twitching motility protein PilT, partial [Oscillospiraceae bacterium]